MSEPDGNYVTPATENQEYVLPDRIQSQPPSYGVRPKSRSPFWSIKAWVAAGVLAIPVVSIIVNYTPQRDAFDPSPNFRDQVGCSLDGVRVDDQRSCRGPEGETLGSSEVTDRTYVEPLPQGVSGRVGYSHSRSASPTDLSGPAFGIGLSA